MNVGGETGVVADVRGLQEMAARALQADYVEYVGDWWLRYSPGSSWWVGTALPHGTASEEGVRKRIFAAERFYDRLGSVTRFQVTPGACPDRLDSMLAENGYRRQSRVSLCTASTAEVQRIRRRTEFSLRWIPIPHQSGSGSGTRSTTMAVTRWSSGTCSVACASPAHTLAPGTEARSSRWLEP